MNLPNKLTILRICMIPPFLWVLLGNVLGDPASAYVATAIFVVASATDALDGYIARSQNLVTTFGKFMDPLADKLLVCAALIALVGMGRLPAWVVIIMVSREFIVTGFRLVAVEKNVVIAAGFWGKLKTVTQMVMIPIVLLHLPWGAVVVVENVLVLLSVVFTTISAVDYIYVNRHVLLDAH